MIIEDVDQCTSGSKKIEKCVHSIATVEVHVWLQLQICVGLATHVNSLAAILTIVI